MYEDTLRVYPEILDEVKASRVKRLQIVGGAGSLFVKPGLRLVDTGTLPEAWLPGSNLWQSFFLKRWWMKKNSIGFSSLLLPISAI